MSFPLLRKPYALTLFGLLMSACVVLMVVSFSMICDELDKPWAGFAFNKYGAVMQAYHTDLVVFDKIIAVDQQALPVGPERGPSLRQYVRSLTPGTPVTYTVKRNGQIMEVTHVVRLMTRKAMARMAIVPMLVGLGQLIMGAVVFLLRPNTKRSWVFLAFCLSWFGLCFLLYDFHSAFVFHELFMFCWFMTSALMLHLAFVFPEERQIIRQKPWLQVLFYAPSGAMWLSQVLCSSFFPNWIVTAAISIAIAQIHTAYWFASLLVVLISLKHTAMRAPSAVARCRAGTVFLGFAAGFIIPVGSESAAMLFRQNWGTDTLWLLTLFLPLSITYATLRYNLFDIGVIMRRSLTYVLLSALVLASYLGFVWFANKVLNDLPMVQGRGFPVLFALAVLLVMNPLRERVQHLLDRSLFRSRYDFRQTIEGLSRDLTAMLDLDEIANRLVHTVTQALGVSRVALFLDDDDDRDHDRLRAHAVAGEDAEEWSSVHPSRQHPVMALLAERPQGVSRYDLEADPTLAQRAPEAIAAFEHLGMSLALPIRFKGDLIGVFALGEKASGAIFTEADLELLRTLTNQSAVAIANARAYQSLEAKNAELRTALRKVEVLENVKTHLSKFVPTSVQRLIDQDPTAPALDKHEQDVSVLFLDIAGYTSISQALDQAKVNYLVERYFSSFLDDIYANQGDINETAGDGLMIIFQDDNPEVHARAAVQTALSIRDKAERINNELQGQFEPVTVNMGINSGQAAVGSTKFEGAAGTRWTFTASGPVTNLAARIGAFATDGSICVGEATARRLSEVFERRRLGQQSFKNVNEPVSVYEILGLRNRMVGAVA